MSQGPAELTVHHGAVTTVPDGLDLDAVAAEVCATFGAASKGAVSLKPKQTDVQAIPSSMTTTTALLELRLASLLAGTPAPAQLATRDVGLVFADRFHGSDVVLGIMFDAGAASTGVPAFDAVPRQGAAVFLGAIAVQRDADQIRAEAVFTAIHELGHVFNLWHVEWPADAATPEFADHFLASSPAGRKAATGSGFLPRHAAFLSWAVESAYVRPGGLPFGTRGALGPAESVPQLSAFEDEIVLASSFAQGEFHSFEPMELDIHAGPAVAGRGASVLDRFDPGFDEFQVWITSPSGRRRRFDPGVRLCAAPNPRAIDAKRPMRRDVTLYLQRGLPVFDEPGEHRIDANFRVASGAAVRSASLPVHVISSAQATPRQRRLRSVMTHPESVRLLATRRANPNSAAFRRLRALCLPRENDPTLGGVAYVLARAIWRHGRRKGRAAARARTVACRLLEQAAASLPKSTHRHRKAVALLDGRIDDPDDRRHT